MVKPNAIGHIHVSSLSQPLDGHGHRGPGRLSVEAARPAGLCPECRCDESDTPARGTGLAL